ncbi:hypothetical protein F5146DRAFT_1102746 [Armillaria mellea]|nr:hypothetical protein F5146DRAFT_1102746 [Armillaria mellea]
MLDIIRSAFQDESFLCFHLKGFKQMWQQPDGISECVYGKAYTSDMFLEMEDQITPEPGCSLETVVIPMMVYSNSTCLANFGMASLWPGYLDNIQDMYMKTFGSLASKELLTFLKHELIQKIWKLLLDPEFMHTYEHGIVIECADGIVRRVYPCFFTYSADYLEKVLLASIKSLGHCLCPQCHIIKEKRQHEVEMVRKWIFTHGFTVSSKWIENVLGKKSLTANWNTFSEALLPLGFNYYQMLVPDLMHESESGRWKSLFTHLICICYEIPGAIPPFNLFTYKNHALSDYIWTIPIFGTTNSYSTQIASQRVTLYLASINRL